MHVRGHVYRIFDELVIRDKGCRFVLELRGTPTAKTEREAKPRTLPQQGVAPAETPIIYRNSSAM